MKGKRKLRLLHQSLLALVVIGVLTQVYFRWRNWKGVQLESRSVEILSGQTQGTTYTIRVAAIPTKQVIDALRNVVSTELELIDKTLSNWNPDSELNRLNKIQSNDWIEVSPMLVESLGLALEYQELTLGYFNVCVGSDLQRLGYEKGLSAQSRSEVASDNESTRLSKGANEMESRNDENSSVMLLTDQNVQHTASVIGRPGFEISTNRKSVRKIHSGVWIDLDGMAQGYSVDRISDLLRSNGIHDFLVEIGGEIYASGTLSNDQKWRVGLEVSNRSVQDRKIFRELTVELQDMAISSSGRRTEVSDEARDVGSQFIDPVTGQLAQNSLTGVTVIAKSCAEADALCTACMVMGIDVAKKWTDEHHIPAFFQIEDGEGSLTVPSLRWADFDSRD